jgi:hypothetical protein
MRGPILIPLVIAGVIVCKVLMAFGILTAFMIAIPVIASLALAGGTVFVLVMAVVFIVRFIVYCARGFRSAEPRVLTAQPVNPPAGQGPAFRPDYRTVYGYRRRPSLFWNVFVIVGGIVLLAVVLNSARHRDRFVSWEDRINKWAERIDRHDYDIDRDGAETERDWTEARHDWAEAQRELQNIPKYVQDKVSKEMRAVEQKIREHAWHGKTPIPPMPPAPPAPPGDNEHPEALTETTAQDSKVLKSWDIKRAQGTSRDEAIQKGLAEAQKKLIEFLREQSPSIAWVPTPEYIREQMVKHIDDKPYDTGVGVNPAVDMRVEVRANQVAEMRKIDHRMRVNGRLESMGRLLAIVVAALAGVSGYIRADLWSKGSYTNLLRLGLLAGLAAVGIGIWYLPL